MEFFFSNRLLQNVDEVHFFSVGILTCQTFLPFDFCFWSCVLYFDAVFHIDISFIAAFIADVDVFHKYAQFVSFW